MRRSLGVVGLLVVIVSIGSVCDARRHHRPPRPNPTPTPTPPPPSGNWTSPPLIGGDVTPWGPKSTPGGNPVGWLAAVMDTRRTDPGWVECDWVRLHIGSATYTTDWTTGWIDGTGGDYGIREGWSPDGFTEQPGAVAKAFDGTSVIVQPSDAPAYAFHWWGMRATTGGACWAEARVRIHGSCVVEIGVDYHTSNSITNNSGSGFIFHDSTSDWQIIQSGKP